MWAPPKKNVNDNKYSTIIEIVGLDLGGADRFCERHEICGNYVTTNDILVLRETCLKASDNILYDVVEARKIEDGTQACRIGFLARRFLRTKSYYVNKMYQVVKDYRSQDNVFDQKRNKRSNGLVECKMLSSIEEHFHSLNT